MIVLVVGQSLSRPQIALSCAAAFVDRAAADPHRAGLVETDILDHEIANDRGVPTIPLLPPHCRECQAAWRQQLTPEEAQLVSSQREFELDTKPECARVGVGRETAQIAGVVFDPARPHRARIRESRCVRRTSARAGAAVPRRARPG